MVRSYSTDPEKAYDYNPSVDNAPVLNPAYIIPYTSESDPLREHCHAEVTFDILEDSLLFIGDWKIEAYASDRAGNETEEDNNFGEFYMNAQLFPKFNPAVYHKIDETTGYITDEIVTNPKERMKSLQLKSGETGILKVTVGGYATMLRIDFSELAGMGFEIYKGGSVGFGQDTDPRDYLEYDETNVRPLPNNVDYVIPTSYQPDGSFTVYYQVILPIDIDQYEVDHMIYRINAMSFKNVEYTIGADGNLILQDLSGKNITINDTVNVEERLVDPAAPITTPIRLQRDVYFHVKGSIVDDYHTVLSTFS